MVVACADVEVDDAIVVAVDDVVDFEHDAAPTRMSATAPTRTEFFKHFDFAMANTLVASPEPCVGQTSVCNQLTKWFAI